MAALLFAVNCNNIPNAHNDGDTTATVFNIDTLCTYLMENVKRPSPYGTFVFQNNDQLTSFLDSTGYDENDKWTKKMTHRPDFKKWAYFAFTGNAWPYVIGDIADGKDTVMINYTRYFPPICKGVPGCIVYEPSFTPSAHVYFIQFTRKTIAFAETIDTVNYEFFWGI
jgi:hypothetical protein